MMKLAMLSRWNSACGVSLQAAEEYTIKHSPKKIAEKFMELFNQLLFSKEEM